MKTTRPVIVIAALSLLAVIACGSFISPAPAPISVSAGDTFDLPEGGTAILGSTGWTFTFVQVIKDQRCPTNIECAEAGGMSVEVELAKDDLTVSFDLQHWLGSDYPIAERDGVRVQFTDLEPYPRDLDRRPPGPYIATFEMLTDDPAQTPEDAPDPNAEPGTSAGTVTAAPGEPFSLAEGDTAALADSGVTLTFTQLIEDARCPLSVNCAEAGGMTIRIELTGDNQSEQFEFDYNLGEPLPTAELQGVTVQFTDLLPYPEDFDPPDEPYRATFVMLDPDDAANSNVLDNVLEITEGETQSLGDSGVSLTFVEVLEDTRCPVDLECEVAGWVTLSVELSSADKSGQFDFIYYLGDDLPSLIEWDGVAVQYVDLAPYPQDTDPITEPYVATFAYSITP